MTAFTINHYQTLEVAETASQGEIKQAYRRLAKELHPDSQSTRASHEQITQLNAAYEILGDRQRRAHYDRQRQRAGVVSEETLRDRAERPPTARPTIGSVAKRPKRPMMPSRCG
jgi:molecular chaperone DnaJ